MRTRSIISISVFTMIASATSISAQASSTPSNNAATPTRHGFFISAGLGYGSAGLKCDGCTTDRENGLSGYFRLGGTINPNLRLGVESNGWAKTVNGVDEQIGFVSGMLYVYPIATNNFWIKGGIGFAAAKESDNADEIKSSGVGVSAGIGYDWEVSRGGFVISPYAGYLRQLSGKVTLDGSDTGVSATADLFQVGIGLGFRH